MGRFIQLGSSPMLGGTVLETSDKWRRNSAQIRRSGVLASPHSASDSPEYSETATQDLDLPFQTNISVLRQGGLTKQLGALSRD